MKTRFRYACELVEEIRRHGDFCIGAACYPEGHVENEHKADDIRYLKQKVDSGVDFLTTQMFFDNDIHYNFLYRIREAGITVPVLPGIMPITSASQMKRSQKLSGTVFPAQIPGNSGPVRRVSCGYEAGRHCIRYRSDYRSAGKRGKEYPYLFNEPAGCGGGNYE